MNIRRVSRTIPRLARKLHTNPAVSSGSVNSDEIAFFSKLSAHWWDEHGEFAFLHRMNPARVQFIKDKLLEAARDDQPVDATEEIDPHSVLKGLDALDIGCGGGLLSESLARLGARTTGIDASSSNISIAATHASADPKLTPSSKSLTYIHTSAEDILASQQNKYDVVCSMEVLEHVDNPAAFLSTCAELVKPGGHLFLSTISRTPLAYALTIFMAENVLRKVSRGTHTYSKFIKPSELIQFFREYRSPSTTSAPESLSRPWITTPPGPYLPRTQAEVRGLIYNPLQAKWHLASRNAWGATDCNYVFWVRKPKEGDA
ncbi:ubiquinone biosynthesis O-methyltransferase [Cyathus striatus]|nr:ubiquinone biosynthesis O-methyltransferase [Cyathus striatus]